MTSSTRVYVPATMADLETLQRLGQVEANVACAVTEALRGSLVDEDVEVLENEALLDAAELSVERLGGQAGVVRRRVVLAADLPTSRVVEDPLAGASVVRLTGPLSLAEVMSVHIDESAVGSDAELAELADLDLLWFSVEEITSLLDPG